MSKKPKNFLRPLQTSLEDLRVLVGMSHLEWSDLLSMKPKEYDRFRVDPSSVSLATLNEVCERYHLSLENLVSGKIDFKAVQALQSRNLNYVPEKYLIAPFSRFQTARVMFEFLESRFGPRFVALVFRHFGIHPDLFGNGNGWINNVFFTDLFLYLETQYSIPKTLFFEMGRQSTKTNFDTPLGKSYRSLSNVKTAFEMLFGELMPAYEKNSFYQVLKADSNKLIVRTRSKRDVADALGIRHLGNPEICSWKSGVFSVLPGYLGLPDARVEEPKCVHRGDSFCIFQISYGHLDKNRFPIGAF